MKKSLIAPAIASALALTVAGCAKAPDATPAASGSASSTGSAAAGSGTFKACMVSDEGGFDDKSFNQTSHDGLEQAVKELEVKKGEMQSATANDFTKNINQMVQAKCNIIVTVGFMLGDATVAAAKANPNVKFAIVDWNDPSKTSGLKNLKPLIFNTAQPSFMAGYTAAAMSKTGSVGTFGGMNIPTVTIFMDGFHQGATYYNSQKSKNVKVLGWDPKNTKGGQFTGNFSDVAGGSRIASTLTSQGADVIFPVAGPAGEGALQVAKKSGGKVNAVWVDTDGCVSSASYCPSIMTSVQKAMDVAVFDAIKAAKDGSFSADPYVGTLENDGVQLAEFHEFDSKVPAELKTELEAIKGDIVSGKIKIESASQPK
ncbi:nucleoside-binding protein [Luteococcus japonicus]|uniref:Nucleoside-binding protein n=1 Tax=Luteococcus japonicus TaxID=33984 RepID=A0A3N1ZSD3_9ACTN|nr:MULTISPECIES: BMP family ABC transporter substrate-binding protein [Luteococcus]MDN5563514.1 BMP family ABC transporter substrate-binding protein [Luteococcus sp.]ROR53794.1 nucleoside-binding protein [Luteococcus japonicus]